ncbi:hypothetical protein RND71_016195 [Anisodus tanguticus]|uniref:Polyphenol oxidase C-terminal domain-containing protein n=1 Tax=Anisodus tanguticus TaxID=243964 RepID=A0AAE1VDJ2_9SOLA|nr:hypothetical protein RND71_016195 [Anisodus tanguticus]
MPTPWRNFKPTRKTTTGKVNTDSLRPVSQVFPLAKLDKAISFSINRPASSRTQKEKNEQEEMLTFNGVKYDDREYIRFDVLINAEKTVNANELELELDKVEFAGSYTSLPHVHANHNSCAEGSSFQLAITELLEDNGLEDEHTIAVTLVPKAGGKTICIKGAEITLEAWIYGVANVAPLASATPIPSPIPPTDNSCGTTEIGPNINVPYPCCPPKLDIDPIKVPYYKFPTGSKLHIRPAAHALDEEYMAKYNLAITKMKELDVKVPSDLRAPISIVLIAMVHTKLVAKSYKFTSRGCSSHSIDGACTSMRRYWVPLLVIQLLVCHIRIGTTQRACIHQPNVYPDLYDPRCNQNHCGLVISDLGH